MDVGNVDPCLKQFEPTPISEVEAKDIKQFKQLQQATPSPLRRCISLLYVVF